MVHCSCFTVRLSVAAGPLCNSTRMCDFPVIDSSQLSPFQRHDCDGFTGESRELHFKCVSALIDMHDRTHVAHGQSFRRQVGCKDYALVFFDLAHNRSSSGYAVTNLGAALPASRIQTVLTRGERLTGVVSSPSTT